MLLELLIVLSSVLGYFKPIYRIDKLSLIREERENNLLFIATEEDLMT